MSIQLGLVGNSIAQSRSPALHQMLGQIYGVDVSYTLHDPMSAAPDAFAVKIQQLQDQGYRGCNVTYPFKQLAVDLVDKIDRAVAEVESTNTLLFCGQEIHAKNTDYSGFIAAYRSRLNAVPAGRVVMLGAGGVGRAVAFGLFQIGASHLTVFDTDSDRAQQLVTAINDCGYDAKWITQAELEAEIRSADGLVNCTPVGHHSTPGNPIPPLWLGTQTWAFDAVYVPIDTEFLVSAKAAGLKIISGFDLFFFQGIDAFEGFTGIKVEPVSVLDSFKAAFNIQSDLF